MGRLISIELYFKGGAKTRIINIYINCNEKEKNERNKLLEELKLLIREAEQKNLNILIMGDLNADAEKYDTMYNLNTKGKYKILEILRNKGLYDTQAITNAGVLEPTWRKNDITSRRIDYIWVSESIVQDIILTKVHKNEMIRSDHHLLIMTMETRKIYGNRSRANERKQKITRSIFNFKEMNKDKWKNF